MIEPSDGDLQKKFISNLEKKIDTLQKSLENGVESKQKIVKILDTFDYRFNKLQLQTTNLNEKIDVLKGVHDNINNTIDNIDGIIGHYQAYQQNKERIEEGVNGNLKSFLGALENVNTALLYFGQHQNFRVADKIYSQLTNLKQKAITILEQEFQKTLEESSKTIIPEQYRDKPNENIILIGDTEMESLQTMAKRLSQLNSFNSTKYYKDVRSKVLKDILDKIYPSQERKKKLNTPLQKKKEVKPDQEKLKRYYDRGSHKTIFYMKFYLQLLKAESKVKDKLSFNYGSVFAEVIELSFAEFIDQLNYLKDKKGDGKNKIFVLCDVLENFENFKREFDVLVGNSKLQQTLNTYSDEVRKMICALLSLYITAINESKTKIFDDGLVHQATSTSFLYLIKLLEYRNTVEDILEKIFFATDPIKDKKTTYLEKYIGKILEAVQGNIKQKRSEYKDLPLSNLFLLNNHQYIVKRLNNPEFKDILNEKFIQQYMDLKKDDEIVYLKSCWDKGLEPLKDLTIPVEPGKAMKSSNREIIKKKFKGFFDTFQHIYDTQQKYAIPDIELREHMRNLTKNYVVPTYETFLKKYQNSDFTTNKGKYIRYDISTINELFLRLYKTDQEEKDENKN